MIRVQLLGPLEIRDEAGAVLEAPAGKPAALLAYLLLEPTAITREEVARLLWPGTARERGLQSVRQALWTLRRLLGEDVFLEGEEHALDPSIVVSDVAELQRALADEDVALAERLWRGPLLERFALSSAPAWQEWLEQERSAIEHVFADTLLHAAQQVMRNGQHERACALAQRAARVQRWSFSARLAWLDLLLDCGQHRSAVGALSEARRDFADAEFQPALAQREARLARAQSSGGDPLVRGELVGRTHELGLLAGLWLSARQGTTQRAVVSGAPGIGKSRLTQELCIIAERDRGRAVRVLAAEADQELEWAGVASFTRQLLRLPGAAGASAASESILRRLVPSLAGSTPRPDGPLPEGGVISDALADLIAAIAWEAPLLVVIDDVRWLDAKSWAVLRRVASQITTEPVLFLFALRTDPADPVGASTLLRVTRAIDHTFLRLPPFTPEETTEFLVSNGGLCSEVAARIAPAVHELTRGVPLFTAEVVRYLRQRGYIVQRGDAWEWSIDAPSLVLPPSIAELFESRLRGLSPAAERVLRELSRGRLADVELQKAAGLDAGSLDIVLDALQDAGLLRTEDEGHRVAHDALAKLMRERGMVREKKDGRRRRLRHAALSILVLLVLGTFVGWLALPPRYGGGELMVGAPQGYDAYHARRWPWRGWTGRVLQRFDDPMTVLQPVKRTTAGPVQLAEIRPPNASPYAAEITSAGPIPLMRDETDVLPADVSPDGRYALLMRDDPATKRFYDRGLFLHERATRRNRLLHQGHYSMARPMWSPDGLLIAVIAQAEVDTLLLLNASGTVLRRAVLQDLFDLSWCGARTVVASGRDEARTTLLFVSLDGAERRWTDPAIVPAVPVACSPDGRHVALQAVRDGIVFPAALDRESGNLTPLPLPSNAQPISWQLPRPVPVPRRVEFRLPGRVVVGDAFRIDHTLITSDSARHPGVLDVTSADNRVVSVRPDGTATANRVGRAVVRFSRLNVVMDSSIIEVQPTQAARLVVREPFADLSAWHVVGEPRSYVTREAGEGVARLMGDHNFSDGIVSRQEFSIRAGLTLEAELAIALTAEDWQQIHIGLCTGLVKGDPGKALSYAGALLVDFSYPASTRPKFRRDEARFDAFGSYQWVNVPASFGDGRWHRITINIRPDRYAELHLDGKYVAESAVRAKDLQARPMLCIFGDSPGTVVKVRRLDVWEGLKL